MIEQGTYDENIFLGVCEQNGFPENSTKRADLRDTFKRVYAGNGKATTQEANYVGALVNQYMKSLEK